LILATVVVCLWLAACALCDLKWREVPPALTLPPLFGAVLWNVFNGNFAVALFVLVLCILADVSVQARGFANGLQAVIFCLGVATSPDPWLASATMLMAYVIWAVWRLEKMGGADAQILLALVLVFGPAILLPITLAGGVQGLGSLVAKKKTIPYMVSILAGTSVFLVFHPSIF
jgi:prepilin signal peptidase PulO-like enzyme (type II secretory pathway)